MFRQTKDMFKFVHVIGYIDSSTKHVISQSMFIAPIAAFAFPKHTQFGGLRKEMPDLKYVLEFFSL